MEADIFADAKARSARGELRPVIGPTTCERAVATPTSGPLGVFDCFVVTTRIKATERNLPGALGYPFRAVLDYSDFSYTWCKVEQVPGELMIQDPTQVVHTAGGVPEHRGPRTRVLLFCSGRARARGRKARGQRHPRALSSHAAACGRPSSMRPGRRPYRRCASRFAPVPISTPGAVR